MYPSHRYDWPHLNRQTDIFTGWDSYTAVLKAEIIYVYNCFQTPQLTSNLSVKYTKHPQLLLCWVTMAELIFSITLCKPIMFSHLTSFIYNTQWVTKKGHEPLHKALLRFTTYSLQLMFIMYMHTALKQFLSIPFIEIKVRLSHPIQCCRKNTTRHFGTIVKHQLRDQISFGIALLTLHRSIWHH